MTLNDFVGGSYQDQSRVRAGERCINMLPEFGESGAALYPTPGLSEFATFGDSPGRGIYAEKGSGRLFAVYGATLYEVSSAGVPTARGAVAVDQNPAQLSSNGDGGDELLAVSGDSGYLLDLGTNAFTTEVADASHCGLVDGFLWALDPATGTLKISDFLDGTIWDPTQIAQRTAAPDPWKAGITIEREIVLFGDDTGEVFYNAGASPFPFRKRGSSDFDVGIAAYFSLAKMGASCAWLGRSEQDGYVVYHMNGYTPEKISPPGLDWLIQSYADDVGISDAFGWGYGREGHGFYVLQFPGSGRTHVYDARMRRWHERGKWDALSGDFGVYRGAFHAFAFDRNLVCDPQSNKMYSLSSTTYTDVDGDVLRRVRRTSHLHSENKRMFYKRAELVCERGVGLNVAATASGYDPVVGLRYSNDRGYTWSDERLRTIGRRGEWNGRTEWNQCGSGRDRQWEIVGTDPVPYRWYDFNFDFDIGRA